MFYSVDADGNIIMSESVDILPDVYVDIFTTVDEEQSFVVVPESSVSPGDLLTYDGLYDLLAAIPGYNVYPNTAAVNVFTDVLNGVEGNFGYVILSGSDSNSTYLYYSADFEVSGRSITLFSPVTFCNYYSYRPTSSSSYVYTYTVSTLGDISFTVSNQLIYTNLLDGYPDVLPYKSRETYLLFFIIALSIMLVLFSLLKNSKRGL